MKGRAPAFSPGEYPAYLKVNPEEAGMVTGVMDRGTHYTCFVTWPDREETQHSELELTDEPNYSPRGDSGK